MKINIIFHHGNTMVRIEVELNYWSILSKILFSFFFFELLLDFLTFLVEGNPYIFMAAFPYNHLNML